MDWPTGVASRATVSSALQKFVKSRANAVLGDWFQRLSLFARSELTWPGHDPIVYQLTIKKIKE